MALETDLMHILGVEAQRQRVDKFEEKVKDRVEELFALARSRGVHFRPALSNRTRNLLVDCFSDAQRPLFCAPVLSGSTGMNGHGLFDHDPEWIKNSFMVLKTCRIPEACSRLVVERLLHWNLKLFQRVIPELAKISQPLWDEQCRIGGDENLGDNDPQTAWFNRVTSGNDIFFASCMMAGLRRVCKEMPECCPVSTVYLACKRDVDSDACDPVCANVAAPPPARMDVAVH